MSETTEVSTPSRNPASWATDMIQDLEPVTVRLSSVEVRPIQEDCPERVLIGAGVWEIEPAVSNRAVAS